MTSWMDYVTDRELKWFLNKELGCEDVTAIRRHKRDNEITCNVVTLWNGEPEDSYKGKKGVLGIKDEFSVTEDHIGCGAYDTSDLTPKRKKFLYALGYRPLAYDNPYLTDTELGALRFDEQYEAKRKMREEERE